MNIAIKIYQTWKLLLFYIIGVFIKFLAFFFMLHNNCLDFLWQSGNFFTACRQKARKIGQFKNL